MGFGRCLETGLHGDGHLVQGVGELQRDLLTALLGPAVQQQLGQEVALHLRDGHPAGVGGDVDRGQHVADARKPEAGEPVEVPPEAAVEHARRPGSGVGRRGERPLLVTVDGFARVRRRHEAVVPWLRLPIRAVVEAPVERFRAPDEPVLGTRTGGSGP